MEDALSKDVLDDETVKNLLGDDLYKEYLREKSGQNYLGPVHARMRERQGNARCVAGCFVVCMYVCMFIVVLMRAKGCVDVYTLAKADYRHVLEHV